jgi:Mrp family chromosome partitioning ATPase
VKIDLTSIRTVEDVDPNYRLGAPVGDDPMVESFRLLALNLASMLRSEQHRSIAVISGFNDDGRTLTAASTARALSELLPPVILVDADPIGSGLNGFHRPGPLPLWRGPVTDLLQPPAPPLTLTRVGAGGAGLTTQTGFVNEVSATLEKANTIGATVIIDTPPAMSSSLAFHIAAISDGVIYVARRRMQDPAVHTDIRAQLDSLGVRIFGIVFNEG